MTGKLDNILGDLMTDEPRDNIVIERHGAIAELHSAVVDLEAIAEKEYANDRERGTAILEAMIMFGATVTQMPKTDKWLRELKFYAKRRPGDIDLSQYDLDDEIELEYVFKRHRLLTPADIARIGLMTGWRDEENMTLEHIAGML